MLEQIQLRIIMLQDVVENMLLLSKVMLQLFDQLFEATTTAFHLLR